jgi:hypothetical protein
VRVLLQLFVALCLAQVLFGQSLADIARQERQRTARDKHAKVYTNEDVPTSGEVTTAAATPADKDKTEAKPEAKDEKSGGTEPKPSDKSSDSAKPAESPEQKQADLEKEYRQKFAKLRDELALQASKQDVMQRELNLLQQQYYSDPNVALREQTFRGDIDKRMQELDQQKATTDKAKQAIADLEEELRQKGLPAGWAR